MKPPVIHIAYAEDHPLIRQGIISFLNAVGGIEVDIEASNGIELISKIGEAKVLPDVCLLDISMPEMNGFDTIIELKKQWPDVGVLVLTSFDLELYIVRMILSGANGYLLKECEPQELKKAVTAIYNDGVYYSDYVTRSYFQEVKDKTIRLPNLTVMEIIILKECCSDLSYAEIGEKIGNTQRSVEGFRDSIFKKLKINSRVSLALYAVQFGLVPLVIDHSANKEFLSKKIRK